MLATDYKTVKDFVEMMERFIPHNRTHLWTLCYENIMATNQFQALKALAEKHYD